jgi:exopolyphosphatase/guanosine-5'-triphosphate,3'-diphosphate pyrophosphatase
MTLHDYHVAVPSQRASRLAAIDLGTNSIRLVIADAPRSGGYRVIDDEKSMARLGRKSDTPGHLDKEAMATAVDAVAHMCDIAKGFGVRRLRIVATAAVRDAENKDEFIDMIRTRTGHTIEIITAEREAKLACRSVAGEFDLKGISAAIADIGGGSTEFVGLSDGVIRCVHPLKLGAVRLTEQFGTCEPSNPSQLKELREFTKQIIQTEIGEFGESPSLFVGTGGTITSLAAMSLRAQSTSDRQSLIPSSTRGHQIELVEIRNLIDKLASLNVSERGSVSGLSSERADIIVAGLVIIESLLELLGLDSVKVHDRGIRDGIILEMIDELAGASSAVAAGALPTLATAVEFADRCGVNIPGAIHTAKLATNIYDQLASNKVIQIHRRLREVLEAAAILRDVGAVMNYNRHHRHSYHLILHSGLAGFTQEEIEMIAVIARFHRKTKPNKSHEEFKRLSPETQDTVSRLAGILRIADGLDRTHSRDVETIKVEVDEGVIRILALAKTNPTACVEGAQRKSDLFADIFKVETVIRWQDPGGLDTDGKHIRRNFKRYIEDELPGRLIIVEGLDGSGKSTQMDLLKKWVASLGYCSYFSEWNSSDLVRKTTKKGKATRQLSPLTFSLIHAADFADRLEGEILPSLRAGGVVFADRYIYTAFARDTARGMDRDYVRRLYRFAPKPTLAVYFRLPLEEALSRILHGRPELKYYEAGMDLGLSEDPYQSFRLFQGRIYDEYERLVEERGLSVIDAMLPIAEQQTQFRQMVEPHLKDVVRMPILERVDVLKGHKLVGRYW